MQLLDYESTRKALRICLGDKGCAGCLLKGNSKCTNILHKSSYKHLYEDREMFQEANDY